MAMSACVLSSILRKNEAKAIGLVKPAVFAKPAAGAWCGTAVVERAMPLDLPD
jgi:hypothetical protein